MTVLHRLRLRLGFWLALRLVLLLLGVVAGVVWLTVLADAALDLPEKLRVLAPWCFGGLALLVLALGAWQWRRLTETRLARWFEQADASLGNRLINAVQLARDPTASPVQEFLRLEAIALGRQTAAGVAVWPAVRQGVQLAALLAGLVAVAWLGSFWLVGDVLQTVTPRFLDPCGDHPPYSKLHFEVAPGRAEVLYGGQVEVRARTRGRPVDKLWLVAKSGTNTTRTIMFLAPDKSFFQALVNLREPAEYYVTDGQARSYRFPVSIRYTPQITMVEVTTAFPEYTGKAARTAKLTDEAQALPEDTRVSFRVASNRPLKSGLLSLTPVLGGQVVQVPLKPEGQNHVVSGGFALTEPVVFTISVRDVSDLECADRRQGRFNLLPDERPRLFVLEPGRDAIATPTIKVPVRVQAEDDYGITRVVWLRGHNRSIERPFKMELTAKAGPRSVEAAGALDFAKLGVRPGDIIEYYFEAADNYPKGPNLALSRLYRLEIVSQEQYDAILRQAAARKALFEPYFQLGAWLRRLAERARKLDQLAQGTDSEKAAAAKEASALADDLAKYETELGKLLPQAMMFDVEQAFRTTLVEQHTRVGLARKKLSQALANGQLDPKRLAEATEELSQLAQTEQEDVTQPGQQLAAVAQLLARADSFVKLAQQQAALAQMLRRFSDRADGLSRVEQLEMQELADHQRHVREGLRSWLEALPELLAQLPADAQYDPLRNDVHAFIQAVSEAEIEKDLGESARLLTALNGQAGYPVAQKAAEKMDRLISKCNGLNQDGQLCLQFKPSVQRSLGNTLAQILAAMGANPGNGPSGRDGYSLFNDNVGLYGSSAELAGQQAGGRGDLGRSPGRNSAQLAGAGGEAGLKPAEARGRVRLQPDAKFPLRYRELIGEYFRVIAESEAGQGGKE